MSMLRWKDFLATVAGMPAHELTEDTLYGLTQRLEIDSCLLAPYIQFKETGYARNVLYRDQKFEAICLCWEPGQGTAIHNHGGCYGIVYVFEGDLAVDVYKRLDDGSREGFAELATVVSMTAATGTLMLDRAGSIHRIYNPATSKSRAISLHFYAGPLDTMEMFDLESGRVTTKPMQGEPMAYIEPEADVMAAMI